MNFDVSFILATGTMLIALLGVVLSHEHYCHRKIQFLRAALDDAEERFVKSERDAERAHYAAEDKLTLATRRAEEAGYAKGLRDGRRITCEKCNGYIPGHATGAADICICEPVTVS